MKCFLSKILVFCLLISCGNIYSQTKAKIPSDLDIQIRANPRIDILKNKYNRLLNLDFDRLTTQHQSLYYLTKSSYRLYLGKDSSEYYLNQAFKLEPRVVCGILRAMNEHNEGMAKEYGYKSWYLADLPDFDEDGFIEMCNEKHPRKKKQITKIIKSDLGMRIKNNDQRYRKIDPMNWEKQNEMDARNRVIIDSVYEARGSLQAFSQYELDVFSMVIHHSNDNNWTMKWIDIFFREKENSILIGGMMLGPAMERFFHPVYGAIVKEEPLRARAFIDDLKKKYPNKVKIMDLEDY